MSTILEATCAIGGVCGILYCCLSLWAAMQFRSRRTGAVQSSFAPKISLLKPLCGVDPHAYESLRSHCIQDYPEFEIIFGVADSDDPIVSTIRDLMREFPRVPIKMVVCSRVAGMNLKVSNLLQMLPAARHEYLVINDSDISVPAEYLRRVVFPLQNPAAGVVTCLYHGVHANTMGSRLESLAISSDFMPGVLAANHIERGMHFALGSTLAFRRQTLEAIGGLEPMADYLADDYELGHRASSAGFRVELADCVVEHYLPAYSLPAFFRHQLRWARTIRNARPDGYAGLILTFAIPWTAFAMAASRGAVWSWVLFSLASLLRLAVASVFGRVILRDRQMWRDLWLLPIRDFIALPIWIASYMGRHVVWRGKKFEITNGKLRPA